MIILYACSFILFHCFKIKSFQCITMQDILQVLLALRHTQYVFFVPDCLIYSQVLVAISQTNSRCFGSSRIPAPILCNSESKYTGVSVCSFIHVQTPHQYSTTVNQSRAVYQSTSSPGILDWYISRPQQYTTRVYQRREF